MNKNILNLLLFFLIIHLHCAGAIADSGDIQVKSEDTASTSNLKPGDVYIVFSKHLLLFDSIKISDHRDTLHSGDSLTVLNILESNWIRLKSNTGDTGYIKENKLAGNAFAAGSSKTIYGLKHWFSQLFTMNKIANWLVMIVFAAIIFAAIRFRVKLNQWFSQFGPEKETEAFGSRTEGTIEYRPNFLNKNFPVTRPSWWIIAPGVVFGIMALLGSIWSSSILREYFSQGPALLPVGFNHTLQWVLWAFTIIVVLLIIAQVLESFTIAGTWGGLLRIIMFLILNAMTIMVIVYLFVALAIVIIAIILLMTLGFMLLGRRR